MFPYLAESVYRSECVRKSGNVNEMNVWFGFEKQSEGGIKRATRFGG